MLIAVGQKSNLLDFSCRKNGYYDVSLKKIRGIVVILSVCELCVEDEVLKIKLYSNLSFLSFLIILLH